jgi:membrane associated rhomboid family serine protease
MTEHEMLWVCIRRNQSRQPIHEWSLVLTSVAIDNEVEFADNSWSLWVHREQATEAETQLDQYAEENQPVPRRRSTPLLTVDSGWPGVAGYLLVIWTLPALAGFGLLDPNWRADGHMQAGLVGEGEWWRTVTALTLHADLGHIVANSLFGALFGLFVGRYLGSGFGWLLVLISGALGNGLNAWLRPEAFSSIGASTATFAALALGAAFVWRRGYFRGGGLRRGFAPIFGGIALLAFTGIGGGRTDVIAHFAGFGVGLCAGLLAASFDIRRLGKSGQYISAGLAFGLLLLAWNQVG